MAWTYATLTSAIQDYLQNTETTFVAYIPTIIQQAERRIHNEVQLPVQRANFAGTCTISNKYLAMPSDFLSVFSLAVVNVDTTQAYLLNKDVEFIREAYPNPATSGVPRFYALFNSSVLILGPTPSLAYAFEAHYFRLPPSIVTAGSSWLGTNAEDALLYGCLIEGYAFMKGDQDLLTLYGQRYASAMAGLKVLGQGKDRQDTYRSNQARVAVP